MFEYNEDNDPITSYANLLTKVKHFRNKARGGNVWVRGQRKYQWELVPTIGRAHYFAGRRVKFNPDQEKALLDSFTRYAYHHFKRDISKWEAIFVGRHHGLPVRLLDWTENPLIALYFATEFF